MIVKIFTIAQLYNTHLTSACNYDAFSIYPAIKSLEGVHIQAYIHPDKSDFKNVADMGPETGHILTSYSLQV